MRRQTKRMMWFATCVLAGAMALATAADKEPQVAGDLLRQAYREAVDAEVARVDQQFAEALKHYSTALQRYGRLQADYPGWQSEIISYRVADCNNQIAAIQRAMSKNAGPDGDLTGGLASETNAEARLTKLIGELRECRVLLPDAEMERIQQAAQDSERKSLRESLDAALRANQVLMRKNARIETRLNRVEKRAPEATTNTPPVLLLGAVKAEARRLMQDRQNSAAAELLRETGEYIPEDSDFDVLRGAAFCRAGDFKEAVAALQPLDRKDLKDASVLVTLGTAYMGLGRLGDARVAMERAVKLDPRSGEAHYNLAQILAAIVPPDAAGAELNYRQALGLGIPTDDGFENTLRNLIILSRMHSKPRETRTPKSQPSRPQFPGTP